MTTKNTWPPLSPSTNPLRALAAIRTDSSRPGRTRHVGQPSFSGIRLGMQIVQHRLPIVFHLVPPRGGGL